MFFIMYLFLFLGMMGLAGVACNPSPHYAALSLVVVAGSGCGLLACLGSSFLSLILFLVYLGGMLVVFAYSIAFMTSFSVSYLENYPSFSLFTFLSLSTLVYCYAFVGGLEKELWVVEVEFNTNGLIQSNAMSVACLYMDGWGFLMISCLALLVVLLAVLTVVRGGVGGALRVV